MAYASCAVAPDSFKTSVGSTKIAVVKREDVREGLAVEVTCKVVETATVNAIIDTERKDDRSNKASAHTHGTKEQTSRGVFILSLMILH